MSDADVETKFAGLSEGLVAPAERNALLSALWAVDHATEMGKVLELVRLEH
jgi:hypothetical protein